MSERNIEAKYKPNKPSEIYDNIHNLCSSEEHHEILQEDIFFGTFGKGRTKLRANKSKGGFLIYSELIYYERPDEKGPKESNFIRYRPHSLDDYESLKAFHSMASGVFGVVEKTREVFLYEGKHRIHFDNVKGLGEFVEIEIVMDENQPKEEGVKILTDLMNKIGLQETEYVDVAYIDLLKKNNH